MTSTIRSSSAVVLVLVMLLSACASQPAPISNTPTPSTSTTTKGRVPNDLMTVEAQAEDIIDFVPGGNWSKVNADISTIDKAWSAYQPQAAKDGATQAMQDGFSQALSRLKSASTSQDALGTLQAANDLGATVVDMFALYQSAVPPEIGRLDVLERQIILDVEKQDSDAANATLAKINTVWESVKPSVLSHDGKDEAAQFDQSLATQAEALGAQDSAALTDEARNGLEIVDALEQVY
jgi:hypothetical protein